MRGPSLWSNGPLLGISLCILVSGCALRKSPPPPAPLVQEEQSAASSTSSAVEEREEVAPEPEPETDVGSEIGMEQPLEALPSVLSIPHFKEMRLEGRDLVLGDVLAKTDAYVRYAITYRSNGLLITGIMNIPKGEGPFPLVILNHGYIARSVYTQGRGLKREQDELARAGFAVLHTDYRGHAGSDESPMTENVYDGNLEYAMDSANAILAVRAAALPTVDATRVGMLGHSLGGGVTLAVLTGRSDLVNAAVLYAPVHADVFLNFMRWRAERSKDDRTVEIFGTREENPKLWDALSPQTFLGDIAVPILLFQGTNDQDVPKEWSDTLAVNLQAAAKDVEYIAYEGEGHEFGPEWTDFMERTVAFLRENLKTDTIMSP